MLAINTAFMTANLALKTQENQVVFREMDAKSKHSENVLKNIDEMYEETKTSVSGESVLAVVTGPGSFTGLRIGVSIAKALACVNKDLKLIALSSLEIMAYIIAKQAKEQDGFVCMLNALSGLAFVCQFDKNGKKIGEESLVKTSEIETFKGMKVALIGDNMQSYSDVQILISSQDLLTLALEKEKEGKFVTERELLPLYLRLSQAEDNLNFKKV